MRVFYVFLAAAIIALSPFNASAQTEPVAPAVTAAGNGVSTLVVVAGVVAVAVVADIVSGGALSGPLLRAVGLNGAPVTGVAGTAALPAAATTATVVAAAPEVVPAVTLTRPWWRFW